MNKFKYYFILLLAGIAIVSCSKDHDDPETVPLRDYKAQYLADNDSIVKYLQTNYIKEVTANFDITIEKIPAGGTQTSIWAQTVYPLQIRDVYNHDVTYKVYYLSLNKGSGDAPLNTDRIFASYEGSLLNGTVFDSSYGVGRSFELYMHSAQSVIDGWGEIFPQFKTGTPSAPGPDGTITYTDFGAGVMFLPSGLGYYGSGQENIPAYSPLVFSFKLFGLQRLDHDFDGVFDYQEDLNGDGYVYDFRDTARYPTPPATMVPDDTDKDGIPDYVDTDDDGDGFSTFYEITKPANQIGWVDNVFNGSSTYYPWDPVVDNPSTPNADETEPRGIPRRPTGPLKTEGQPESIDNPKSFVEDDYKAAVRTRIHLDKTYPYQKK
ncbi:FKBP-type peptidyl-prolyl cis-trans isomerase [Flavobacterium sp. CF108]|uniref:FKBP-type peptidyl-prolyl cis-trans isomerase n=1 Tax=unclassified Flavobacterium TaxID=196869 RepID=UPI0008B5A9A7|nr:MULTISPECIES: FKBP-type peptidyl-prolyl cis-trans isomerase [unclassified Flavobacterium]SEO37264.1 FKBP-type peptidyl-prolyl cis-trans isomerase [Flavobacterium sp. fv08]SHH64679.1 FKBP-type peptidyl-prolyl cis-trans isomerase [Flavobacterium sp. CF108]